jgi:hypothetical protein
VQVRVTSDGLRDCLIFLSTKANFNVLTARDVRKSLQFTVELVITFQQYIVEHAVVKFGVDGASQTLALTLLHFILVIGQQADL